MSDPKGIEEAKPVTVRVYRSYRLAVTEYVDVVVAPLSAAFRDFRSPQMLAVELIQAKARVGDEIAWVSAKEECQMVRPNDFYSEIMEEKGRD